MKEKWRDILLRLSILPLLAVCLESGGAASPFRFFFFPLVALLSAHLAPAALFQTGIAFFSFQAVLALLDKPADMQSLTLLAAESACYLLATWAATRVAGVLAEESTRYRIAESTFQGLNNDLSTRTKNLQTTLDALSHAHNRLKELDRNKTIFLGNIAHELRTPLSGIRSYSEMLLTYNDLDDATQREFLEIIENESVRLTHLVNELLILTKIETGKIELAMGLVNAAKPVEDCIKVMTPMAAEKGLDLAAVIPPDTICIKADKEQVTQVLINLVNNAIKFTRQGGVTVGVARKGEVAEFFVADTGEGIFPEEQEKIFEEFYRVLDNVPNRPQGSGLGLSICKTIVEFHEGEIGVESTVGKGSTFRFTIPLFSTEELSFPVETRERSGRLADGFRPILVVIENNVKRMFLRNSLEGLGYKTLGAVAYDKAYALMKSSPVDLIIAEITNNRDDLESLSTLARSEGTQFYMAYFHIEPQGGISVAMAGYLWKPFDRQLILSMLEPFKKHRMKFAIISQDVDESHRLQVLLGIEGHTTTVFSTVDDFVPSCASLCPDAVIIGTFEEQVIDNIVTGITATKPIAQTPLLLTLGSEPGGDIKLIMTAVRDNKPFLCGLSPLIQEIESDLGKK